MQRVFLSRPLLPAGLRAHDAQCRIRRGVRARGRLLGRARASQRDVHRWLVRVGGHLGCVRGDGQLTRSAPGTAYCLPEYGGIGDGSKLNALVADTYNLCPESCGLLGG